MGMFDWVETPEIKCPVCEEPLTGFQTKDLDCTLSRVSYKSCLNFYTSCDKCKLWVEFNRIPVETHGLENFTMTVYKR